MFAGRDGAPRIVAVIPLCEDGDAAAAVRSLNGSLDMRRDCRAKAFYEPISTASTEDSICGSQTDLMACLDASRIADFVIIILSPDHEVDELGELIIRSVESQGLSTLLTVVQGLDKVEPAKRTELARCFRR